MESPDRGAGRPRRRSLGRLVVLACLVVVALGLIPIWAGGVDAQALQPPVQGKVTRLYLRGERTALDVLRQPYRVASHITPRDMKVISGTTGATSVVIEWINQDTQSRYLRLRLCRLPTSCTFAEQALPLRCGDEDAGLTVAQLMPKPPSCIRSELLRPQQHFALRVSDVVADPRDPPVLTYAVGIVAERNGRPDALAGRIGHVCLRFRVERSARLGTPRVAPDPGKCQFDSGPLG